MQNRLTIKGIPSNVPQLPNAADTLRNLIEEHGCWVDRFAFLSSPSDNNTDEEETNDTTTTSEYDSIVAVAELHIENVRDDAIQSLDGCIVVLDGETGCLVEDVNSTTATAIRTPRSEEYDCNHQLQFTIRATRTTPSESKLLTEQCPIHNDGDDDTKVLMEKQTLTLPMDGMELTVRSNIEKGGGTGSTPWRGGLLLSHQICHWYQKRNVSGSDVDFDTLFNNKTVLELGAGCSGLPSMTLAKIANNFNCDIQKIICSDGIDEIVNVLSTNVQENELDNCIEVRQIDWNDYCNDDIPDTLEKNTDTILFADCIYNDNCAIALSKTILLSLKPGGNVIGVIPDNRVGVDVFERCMRRNGFQMKTLPIISLDDYSNSFCCTGGGGKNYRFLLFNSCDDI
eukprot:scaffold37386_cov69-Cyclotella_meneghiniana.AAC.3